MPDGTILYQMQKAQFTGGEWNQVVLLGAECSHVKILQIGPQKSEWQFIPNCAKRPRESLCMCSIWSLPSGAALGDLYICSKSLARPTGDANRGVQSCLASDALTIPRNLQEATLRVSKVVGIFTICKLHWMQVWHARQISRLCGVLTCEPQ